MEKLKLKFKDGVYKLRTDKKGFYGFKTIDEADNHFFSELNKIKKIRHPRSKYNELTLLLFTLYGKMITFDDFQNILDFVDLMFEDFDFFANNFRKYDGGVADWYFELKRKN